MALGEGAVSFGNIKVSSGFYYFFPLKTSVQCLFAYLPFNFQELSILSYLQESLAQRANLVTLLVLTFPPGSLNSKVLVIPPHPRPGGWLTVAVGSAYWPSLAAPFGPCPGCPRGVA